MDNDKNKNRDKEEEKIEPYIDRAAEILARVAKKHINSLPSTKSQAEAMKRELSEVSKLEETFSDRAKEVLDAIRKRK